MEKLITFAAAIAVCVGTTAMLAKSSQPGRSGGVADIQLANDAAFRDGLFVGKLTAKRGQAMRPPIGRWSTWKDRASFEAGYKHGYSASRSALKGPGRHDAAAIKDADITTIQAFTRPNSWN